MIVYDMEDMKKTKEGCYPTLSCLYSIIPRDVRLHMERVGIYADTFYKYLRINRYDIVSDLDGLFEEYARDLFTLHDIGRAFIPIRFQNKAGGLSDEEYEQIKKHTILAPDALDSIYRLDFPEKLLLHLSNIALYHHERWDGKGYPFGISKEGIPLEARICALADTYDGMTSWKPYRKPMEISKVMDIIMQEAGKQFQPELAYAFVTCIEQLPKDLGVSWEAQAGRYFDNKVTDYMDMSGTTYEK